jgi:hypothetical protein
VNGVVEKTRKKTEASIAVAADAIGIPRMLIDIRHGRQLQLFIFNMDLSLFVYQVFVSVMINSLVVHSLCYHTSTLLI